MERKEAIEVIKKNWPDNSFTMLRKALETVIPELKESEDERIRKALISFLKSPFVNENITYEKVTPWIAWLEKQGEQNPAWSEEDKNMLKWITGYLDNKMLNTPIVEERTACKNAIAWLEKLKDEQKPNYCHHEVDLSGCSEEYCKAYYDGWNNCNQQHAQLEAEQKSAWSEEDETTKNNISHIIRQYDKISKKENQPCWYIGDCLLWMQNIKDRVQSQPKQEWSEEDLYKIEHALFGTYAVDVATKLLNKLKSLRPQNTWKPSEEMLEALYRAIPENTMAISEDEMLLDKLYQGLKYGRVLSKK